ncbi:major facilitator superfamily domain-containing protein [Pisolithus marmoratus]|nr:major facilitator superfamily domain-containing protein [Pisolithus marmoratus]
MAVTKRLSAVSLIFACGTALFSDGYANGIIGAVNTRMYPSTAISTSVKHSLPSVLTRLYPGSKFGTQSYSDVLTSIAFAGTVFGMLVFGWISDKVGRKAGMMSAASIVGVFSALSAGSVGVKDSVSGTIAFLCVCRFIIGVGVGAEYPCGSVSASEQTEQEGIAKNAQHRWLVLATNTMIDAGFVVAAFVPLVLYWIFGENHLRAVWSLSLGLGAVPAFAVLLWRLRMEEPDCYKKNSMKDVRIPYWLAFRRYWKSLLGLSLSWFIYDFITYPFGIYSSTITNNITGGSSSLTIVFGWAVVINLFYIPGTVLGAFLIDYVGPKTTMIAGLLSQAVIGFIMSGLYSPLTSHIAAFAVVYGIFLSLGEVGPGNCLGVLAAKTGPTAIRGQFYGAAAAVGKVGAFVGTWVFPQIIDAFGGSKTEKGNTGPFWIGSGLAIVSALVTFFLVKPLTHDGMKAEDEAFRRYLEEHGFDVSLMGLPGDVPSAALDVEKDEKLAE